VWDKLFEEDASESDQQKGPGYTLSEVEEMDKRAEGIQGSVRGQTSLSCYIA